MLLKVLPVGGGGYEAPSRHKSLLSRAEEEAGAETEQDAPGERGRSAGSAGRTQSGSYSRPQRRRLSRRRGSQFSPRAAWAGRRRTSSPPANGTDVGLPTLAEVLPGPASRVRSEGGGPSWLETRGLSALARESGPSPRRPAGGALGPSPNRAPARVAGRALNLEGTKRSAAPSPGDARRPFGGVLGAHPAPCPPCVVS